jgi:hypothetical protein
MNVVKRPEPLRHFLPAINTFGHNHYELMSSSPQPQADTTILGPVLRKSQKVHFPVEADYSEEEESSRQEKERLFDLTASQIPFPYSQYSSPAEPRLEERVSTDSKDDRTVVKQAPPKPSARKSTVSYRPLPQLACQVPIFTPSLTPTATGSNGKAK